MFALQTDFAFGGQFGKGGTKPARNLGAVRIFLGGSPLGHVHVGGQFAIEPDFELLALGFDGQVVPLAGFLGYLLGRCQMAEDAATVPGGCRLGPFVGEGIGNLNFHGFGNPVLGVGAVDDDAAVGAVVGLELQIEREILLIHLGPEALVGIGGEHAIGHRPDACGLVGIGKVGGKQRRPSRPGGLGLGLGGGSSGERHEGG